MTQRRADQIIGVDVGGTFTDLVLCDPSSGAVRLAKVATTPTNQADGVIAALDAAGADLRRCALIVHGTTTNAVLERKLARTGLITTAGFRDILELGRRTRPQAYGMKGVFRPIIPRDLRLEVPERMDAQGRVVTALDEVALGTAAQALLDQGCVSVVVHFLHAYANPSHELRAAEILRELWPNSHITLGHALLSESREFERGVTAAVNASVQPLLDRYVTRLKDRLAAAGYAGELLVMNGNGGMVSAANVAREAAKTVMSGPASGVMAAAYTGRAAGIGDLITYDMGGGSIARVNAAGLLEVGPDSAGAAPGPICYGRGGELPTISDANLLLGRLDPARLNSVEGGVSLDHLRQIFDEHLGHPLGVTTEAAADAVLRLANVKMAGAIRMVSVSLGVDPRDFALFAFGGAGPLHACALARELGIPRVLIPARPGITNALGCVVADLRHDFVTTLNRPLDQLDMDALSAVLQAQAAEGRALIARETLPLTGVRALYSLDMQFIGQTHLLRVDLDGPEISREALQARFEAAYWQRFRVRLDSIRAAVVNVNCSVIGERRGFDLATLIPAAGRRATLAEAQRDIRQVSFDGTWQATPIYQREALPLRAVIDGPAVIEQMDTTILIPPGDRAEGDAIGNILVTIGGAA
ncbi:hydantoinase/oxoprolinase family protein [Pseudooceanicola sp.]|uniref:hydantoinase/oxoprolinase family protein n=1 Tax=Pseudooceanicola sp. TaxID=1914328 RepID=UPI00260DB7D7|nr:hydantoinase/oxoprolinase family protein [Pseudooceanicola sp.]MDF1855630.1 hydantoinase/oxoprolinase family protein [Pseudooceanicola sp.]